MRMSRGVEWVLHCCALLAELPPGESLSAAQLARFFDVPHAYLAKKLQALSTVGVLRTSSGPSGGYQLGRDANEIALLSIIDAVEGVGRCFICTELRQQGPSAVSTHRYTTPCGIARSMWRAEDAWRSVLSKTTLKDIVRIGNVEVPAEQRRRAQIWLRSEKG
jgi:Rrf2 family protein